MLNDELDGLLVIIPAAGIGSRMKNIRPKQYIELNGKPILWHTIKAVSQHPKLVKFIIVVSKEDEFIHHMTFPSSVEIDIITGGKERADSVYEGVLYAQQRYAPKWVLVHDAARPLVQNSDINKLLMSIGSTPFMMSKAVGAILASPIKDTVKKVAWVNKAEVNEAFYTEHTLPRETLWAAQTPQLFPTKTLLEALCYCKSKGLIVTDESSAIEHFGGKTFLVEGSSINMKLTDPFDLEFMTFYLNSKKQ